MIGTALLKSVCMVNNANVHQEKYCLGRQRQIRFGRADFVFDQTLSGKSLKMLTLVDEHTRECLAVEAGVSITSEQVRKVLQRVCVERGALPEMIRSDNGAANLSERRSTAG